MEKQKKNDRFMYIMLFLIFLTSSFDLIFTVNIFSFTFRISQLICIALIIIYALYVTKTKKVILPIGYKNLLLWVFLLLCFTFNTQLVYINVAYHLWLLFDVAIIFVFVGLINDKEENNKKILKLYLMSFFIMAIIGILEFIISMMGIQIPYITQWWVKGRLPRINGFSYEPSYYATYLLIGWVFCRMLIQNKVKLTKNMVLILLTITLAIILSSSRMGILFMALFEVGIWMKNFIKSRRPIYVIGMLIIGILLVIWLTIEFRNGNLNRYLSGTGLNGSSSHSVTDRFQGVTDILQVFKDSPILGKGLGGIMVQNAINKGLDIYNITIQNAASGDAVFIEVLAASGILALHFLYYI